jgi:hypothetical protein
VLGLVVVERLDLERGAHERVEQRVERARRQHGERAERLRGAATRTDVAARRERGDEVRAVVDRHPRVRRAR